MSSKYSLSNVSRVEFKELKKMEPEILESIRGRLLSLSGIDAGGFSAEMNYLPISRKISFTSNSGQAIKRANKDNYTKKEFINAFYCNVSQRLENIRLP